MEITREVLEARKARLEQRRMNLQANLAATQGAMEMCNEMLEMLDKDEPCKEPDEEE